MIGGLFVADGAAICAIIPGRAWVDFRGLLAGQFPGLFRGQIPASARAAFRAPFLVRFLGLFLGRALGLQLSRFRGLDLGRSTTSAWTDLQAMRFSDWNYQRIVASRLPAAEKLLLLILDVRWGRCSQSELAGYLSVTERRVRQLVAGLQRQGVLEITPSGRENQYRVIFDKLVQSAP